MNPIAYRYCLIVATISHLREQIKDSLAFPGHPKALFHFIVTGQLFDEEVIDELVSYAQYVEECIQVAKSLTVKVFEICELEKNIDPKIGPHRINHEALEALCRYHQRKKNRKQHTLAILPTLQHYYLTYNTPNNR